MLPLFSLEERTEAEKSKLQNQTLNESSYDLGIHEWQLNGLRQQQHRGSEAEKLWAEIWNSTPGLASKIPDFGP